MLEKEFNTFKTADVICFAHYRHLNFQMSEMLSNNVQHAIAEITTALTCYILFIHKKIYNLNL